MQISSSAQNGERGAGGFFKYNCAAAVSTKRQSIRWTTRVVSTADAVAADRSRHLQISVVRSAAPSVATASVTAITYSAAGGHLFGSTLLLHLHLHHLLILQQVLLLATVTGTVSPDVISSSSSSRPCTALKHSIVTCCCCCCCCCE